MVELVNIQGEDLAVEIYQPVTHIGDAVLIHGFTGSKEDFEDLGPLLAAKGYRTLTFDNRGQHESAHSKREDGYSMESLARDAVALAQHFGLTRPHLFGHSFGGLVAQQAAIAAPDNWSTLTLFCSGPHFLPNRPDLDETIKILATMSMEESWNKYKEEVDRLRPRYETYKKRWKASDPLSTKTMAEHLKSRQSIVARVAATKIPVHVVYGESDDAWPLDLQDQMARDLSAPVTVIKEAGHCPNEDQPEVTADVVAEFWSRNS